MAIVSLIIGIIDTFFIIINSFVWAYAIKHNEESFVKNVMFFLELLFTVNAGMLYYVFFALGA